MKLFRSRVLLTQTGPPIEDGAVAIQNGKIAAVGRYRDLSRIAVKERVDLGESIVLPGLINAHCHLDYTDMRFKIPPGKSFCEWLRSIIALKATQTHEQYAAAIREGLTELRSWGATSVFNVLATPETKEKLSRPVLRTWWFHEMMDVRSPVDLERFFADLLEFPKKFPCWLGGLGLSPHAPYTVSDFLYGNIKSFAEKHLLPVCTHLAETSEEMMMFREGSGALFDFLKSTGCSVRQLRAKSPLALLLGEGLLPCSALLVHVNVLEKGDWEILRRSTSRYTIIHCPKTHAYFGREKFHFKEIQEAGIAVCLGTDSLASNDSLNLFEEMRLFHSKHQVTEQEVLNMVTLCPANAIGLAGRLGVLAEGAHADMIALPHSGCRKEALEAVVHYAQPVDWTMIGGVVYSNSP